MTQTPSPNRDSRAIPGATPEELGPKLGALQPASCCLGSFPASLCPSTSRGECLSGLFANRYRTTSVQKFPRAEERLQHAEGQESIPVGFLECRVRSR